MLAITKEFRFDAAHSLPHYPEGHPNRRMHGHSFRCVVTLEGAADPATGLLRDLDAVEAAVAVVRARLDHHVLNEIEGLGAPTLENLAQFIFAALKPALPELAAVTVIRDSYGQTCTWRP